MQSVATVTKLALRSGSYDEGLAAFRRCRLESAVAELTRLADPRSQRLLARTLLRLGRNEEALGVAWAVSKDLPHAELAERALLVGVAETRLDASDEARASFGEAAAYAMSSPPGALSAEIELYQALLAFALGDADEAAKRARGVLASVESSDEWLEPYVVPLAHTHARAREILTSIAMTRCRSAEAVASVKAAIATLEAEPVADDWILSQNLTNLAVLARDLDLPLDAAFVQTRLDAIEWTRPLASRHFSILSAIGWCDAHAGDHLGALRWFRRAGAIAPSVPERIVALLARVALALELDHGIMADEELSYALELAARVDWERTPAERGVALLELAQVAAPRAPLEARRALDRYRQMRPASAHAGSAPLLRAEDAYAEGRVVRAEGDPARAVALLRVAFERWAATGVVWRATLAAVELTQLGEAGRYREYAAAYAARRPLSWIARRFQAG